MAFNPLASHELEIELLREITIKTLVKLPSDLLTTMMWSLGFLHVPLGIDMWEGFYTLIRMITYRMIFIGGITFLIALGEGEKTLENSEQMGSKTIAWKGMLRN